MTRKAAEKLFFAAQDMMLDSLKIEVRKVLKRHRELESFTMAAGWGCSWTVAYGMELIAVTDTDGTGVFDSYLTKELRKILEWDEAMDLSMTVGKLTIKRED